MKIVAVKTLHKLFWKSRVPLHRNGMAAIPKMMQRRAQHIVQSIWGCVIYQRKKNRSKWNKAFGFCFGTAIGFFSGSLENWCSLKNRIFTSLRFLLYFSITLRFFHTISFQGFSIRDSVYEVVWGRLRSENMNPL